MRASARVRCALLAGCLLAAAATQAVTPAANSGADGLDPVRVALRTLQYDRAIALLQAPVRAGKPGAERMLGLIYLNGIGVVVDRERALTLLRSAAGHADGAAAYVLAAELARTPTASAAEARDWLARSATLGYPLAQELRAAGRLPLEEASSLGTDGALLVARAVYCAQRDDAACLEKLDKTAVIIRDAFGRTALAHAADAGAVNAATTLLKRGADTHTADQGGVSALMLAAGRPETTLTQLLLTNGADANAADAEKRTPLFYAARANRPQTIALLQKSGARLDARDSRGYGALDAALAVEARDAATQLRSLGVVPLVAHAARAENAGKFNPAIPGQIYQGWSTLALAVARNDAETVQQQLAAGASVNQPLQGGGTVLLEAVSYNATAVIPLLLAAHANVLSPDQSGHTALWWAANQDDPPSLKLLLAGGVKPDAHSDTEEAPLLAAVRAGRMSSAQRLLDAGAAIDTLDKSGTTPLMIAAAAGNATLIQALLARHADVRREDAQGRTALWYAAQNGAQEPLAALLAAGASVADADKLQLTALHAAAAAGHTASVQQLLGAGAAINARSNKSATPLMLAAAAGQNDTVTLLAKSAAIDAQDDAGNTALIVASRAGYDKTCKVLLNAGANRGLRNTVRASAADVASARGFDDLARLLSVGS